MMANHPILSLLLSWLASLGALAALSAEPPPGKLEAKPETKSESALGVKLPDPPARMAGAAAQAKTCLECHEEIADLLKGDKHIAEDFHCVVCHGRSQAHVELKVEGTLPDRAWRRWIQDENRFQWRMKNASLEIAKYCGSCHARKGADREETKRIDWEKYLETGHGVGVSEGGHDAATCTDCHEAHGAGHQPWTDKLIVQRCSICHGDKELAKRNALDPNVMKDFKADKHGDMPSSPAEKKTSCIKCHRPH